MSALNDKPFELCQARRLCGVLAVRSERKQRSFFGTLSEYRERKRSATRNQDALREPNSPTEELATSIQASVEEIAVMWVLHNWSRAGEQRAEDLDQQIDNFSEVAIATIADHYPMLANAEQKHLWMIYFKGLLAANTHPHEQMVQAIKTVRERSFVEVFGETITKRALKPVHRSLSDLDALEHISQALRQTDPAGA